MLNAFFYELSPRNFLNLIYDFSLQHCWKFGLKTSCYLGAILGILGCVGMSLASTPHCQQHLPVFTTKNVMSLALTDVPCVCGGQGGKLSPV